MLPSSQWSALARSAIHHHQQQRASASCRLFRHLKCPLPPPCITSYRASSTHASPSLLKKSLNRKSASSYLPPRHPGDVVGAVDHMAVDASGSPNDFMQVVAQATNASELQVTSDQFWVCMSNALTLREDNCVRDFVLKAAASAQEDLDLPTILKAHDGVVARMIDWICAQDDAALPGVARLPQVEQLMSKLLAIVSDPAADAALYPQTVKALISLFATQTSAVGMSQVAVSFVSPHLRRALERVGLTLPSAPQPTHHHHATLLCAKHLKGRVGQIALIETLCSAGRQEAALELAQEHDLLSHTRVLECLMLAFARAGNARQVEQLSPLSRPSSARTAQPHVTARMLCALILASSGRPSLATKYLYTPASPLTQSPTTTSTSATTATTTTTASNSPSSPPPEAWSCLMRALLPTASAEVEQAYKRMRVAGLPASPSHLLALMHAAVNEGELRKAIKAFYKLERRDDWRGPGLGLLVGLVEAVEACTVTTTKGEHGLMNPRTQVKASSSFIGAQGQCGTESLDLIWRTTMQAVLAVREGLPHLRIPDMPSALFAPLARRVLLETTSINMSKETKSSGADGKGEIPTASTQSQGQLSTLTPGYFLDRCRVLMGVRDVQTMRELWVVILRQAVAHGGIHVARQWVQACANCDVLGFDGGLAVLEGKNEALLDNDASRFFRQWKDAHSLVLGLSAWVENATNSFKHAQERGVVAESLNMVASVLLPQALAASTASLDHVSALTSIAPESLSTKSCVSILVTLNKLSSTPSHADADGREQKSKIEAFMSEWSSRMMSMGHRLTPMERQECGLFGEKAAGV